MVKTIREETVSVYQGRKPASNIGGTLKNILGDTTNFCGGTLKNVFWGKKFAHAISL
jgi:hypothetical protein